MVIRLLSLLLAAWSLMLAAQGLPLVACILNRLVLDAWRYGPVAILPGPCFMELVNNSSVLHKLRWGLSGSSRLGNSYTCLPDQAPDMFLMWCLQSTSTATTLGPVRQPWLLKL